MSQVKIGTVISNKMQKTVVVEIETRKKHPLYKKILKKTKKIKARDELGTKPGDKIKISETKPIARNVHFKVVEVLK